MSANDDDRRDMNGSGNGDDDDRGSKPSLPPLSSQEMQGLLEETIHHQADDERWIERLDRRTQTLVAGTSKWQREMSERLERIEGCVTRLTNQTKLMANELQALRWAKVGGPALLALFAGGLFGELLTFVLTKH